MFHSPWQAQDAADTPSFQKDLDHLGFATGHPPHSPRPRPFVSHLLESHCTRNVISTQQAREGPQDPRSSRRRNAPQTMVRVRVSVPLNLVVAYFRKYLSGMRTSVFLRIKFPVPKIQFSVFHWRLRVPGLFVLSLNLQMVVLGLGGGGDGKRRSQTI